MRRYLFVLTALLIFVALPRRASTQALSDMADVLIDLSAPQTEHAGKTARHRFTSGVVAASFNGVVVQGFGTGEILDGWVRFEEDSRWSEWLPLYLVRSATDAAFLAAYRGPRYRQNQRFELRFDGEPDAQVQLLGAGVFDTRNDVDYLPWLGGDRFNAPAKTSDYLIVPPDLIPRAAWNAAPFRGTPAPLNRPEYVYITFHHAAGFGATTREEGLQQVKAIQDFHQNGRGWSDIGYQFVMDQSGRLYQGRPFMNSSVPFEDGPPLALGAHAGGANTGNIGVCVLGCYHPPEGTFCRDQMTGAALDSLVTTFAYLSERYGVPPENIRGHRDFSATACPGDNNYPLLPFIREQDRDLLRTGNRPLGTASMAATVDAEGVVQLSWSFVEDGGITAYQVERVYDNEETIIFEGSGAVAETITDVHLARTGEVTYRLRARNATGREQVLAVADLVVEAPEDYTLVHNFPNPFQESTTIRYYLAREGVVTLTIVDVMGRVVTTLVDEFQGGERWHTVPFDASGLSSGTYYYQLQVEGFAGTEFKKSRSLVLMK